MLFDPETANDLRPWLVKTLEPVCDAEPGALADYILALLKHNAPEAELRKELASQLEEFLEKGPSFIDTLFTALRTKSYLPYSAASPSSGYLPSSTPSVDTGIPIPLDALLSPSIPTSPDRGRKRSIDHDDHEMRPPTKGPRLNGDGQFSRYGRNDSRSSWGGRGERGGRMAMNGRSDYVEGSMNGGMDGGMGHINGRGPQYRPPDRRGICRDYHNNGYCARGAFCKYSHGDDAVIPSQLFPMNGPMGVGSLPFVPMLPNSGIPFGMGGGSNAAYDPHERMDMRPIAGASSSMSGRPPNPRAPIIPRHGDIDGAMAQKPGELPVIQDLTPQGVSDNDLSRTSVPDGPSASDRRVPGPSNHERMMNGARPMGGSPDVDMVAPPMSPNGRFGGPRGSRMAGPRGTFGGDVHSFRPEKRNDKTLVVEKIPEDKLSLGSVNEWFKRFGTVTNVAVDAVNSKALVSFSTHDEAHAAWRSEDAVFGNRFVKVFWHRPMEGHGQMGVRMLAASAPLVATITSKDASPTQAAAGESSATPPATPSAPSARKPSTSFAAAALAAKQRLLEQQIAEQKSLMALLSAASPEEKKDIMARLRKLGEEMKPSASASQSSRPVPTPAPAAAPKKPRGVTPRSEDQERLERERLDKELELHHATGAIEGEVEESTEDLKVKLAKLKAEAASLGLPEAAESPYPSTSYRPYRGRGRGGRGFFRGAMRGGARASMKLDNRPKRLLLKGASGDNVQAIRDWYETTGQVETVDVMDNGDVLVAFRTRAAAEQGFSKGASIPTVGQVQISWYSGQQLATAGAPKPPSPIESSYAAEDKRVFGSTVGFSGPTDDIHMHEEVAASGWGGDDGEDGFAML
ncbi:hypothetical protein BKA93DRAFT_301444 [Sparassis latifolia]